ncbi:hypothetical protein GCM10020001_000990 [Nonomuraea salmonea]
MKAISFFGELGHARVSFVTGRGGKDAEGRRGDGGAGAEPDHEQVVAGLEPAGREQVLEGDELVDGAAVADAPPVVPGRLVLLDAQPGHLPVEVLAPAVREGHPRDVAELDAGLVEGLLYLLHHRLLDGQVDAGALFLEQLLAELLVPVGEAEPAPDGGVRGNSG